MMMSKSCDHTLSSRSSMAIPRISQHAHPGAWPPFGVPFTTHPNGGSELGETHSLTMFSIFVMMYDVRVTYCGLLCEASPSPKLSLKH